MKKIIIVLTIFALSLSSAYAGVSFPPSYGGAGETDHGELTGLTDDDHTIYGLLLGRSGGQTIIGGTGSSDDIHFKSTSHGTKGQILFGEWPSLRIADETEGGTVAIGNNPFYDAAFTIGTTSGAGFSGGDWLVWFRHQGTQASNESLIRHEHFSDFAGTSAIPQPVFTGIGDRGTIGSSVTLGADDFLLIMDGRGYNGTAISDTSAQIAFRANQTWTNTAQGSYITLSTTPDGSASPAVVVKVTDDAKVSINTSFENTVLNVESSTADASVFYVTDATTGNIANTINLANLDATVNNTAGFTFRDGDIGANSASAKFGAIFTDRTNNYADLAVMTRSGDGLLMRAYFKAAGHFAVGADTSGAQVDVTQPGAAAAIPVLELDQDDTSEPFVNFVGTATADANSSISTLNTSGATTDHIQIDLNGAKAWIAVSTNNPS